MIPLELTHEVRAKEPMFQFLETQEQIPFARAIREMLLSYQVMYNKAYGFDYPPIHDPCVINYIVNPEDFVAAKVGKA